MIPYRIDDLQNLSIKFLEQTLAYIGMASLNSSFSEASRRKVGAIIVSKEGKIIGSGYNGTPSGTENVCEYQSEDGSLVTHEHVLHAEINAIFNATTPDLEKSAFYLTLSPCVKCAAALVHKKVGIVIYRDQYRDPAGIEYCRNNGVRIHSIQEVHAILQQHYTNLL